MAKSVSKMVSATLDLVGFRGTEDEIRSKLSSFMNPAREASFDRFEKDTSIDIGYLANLGMSSETYLDFDIFIIETRETKNKRKVLYITEVTFIG